MCRSKAMAPHSSTLAWRIPWTEEPGGLQSMGSLGVWDDWETSLSLFTFMHWRGKWNPLQCSCLENPRDGGAWWAAVSGVAQNQTRLKWLSSSSSDYKAHMVAALTSSGIQVVLMAPRATLHLCSAFSSQGLPRLQALMSAPWVPGLRATVRCCLTKGWAGRKERGWDEVTEINGWYFNLLFFFFFFYSINMRISCHKNSCYLSKA